MLKWEPGLKYLHYSRMRVVGHKSFMLILQWLGVLTYILGGLECLGVLDSLEMLDGFEVLDKRS